MSFDKLLENLNESQKAAVCWPNKPLLIVAGAGSGKTRILVHRIAYQISQGTPAFNILGVTFTNKAAAEMKRRVQSLINQQIWVSTFHSTCLRILRMDGRAIGLESGFTIYDDHDQSVLVKECIRELKLNEKQVHPKGVLERIQRAKDLLMNPKVFAANARDLYDDAVSKIYTLYEKKMSQFKACDFGDLMMKTVQLFEHSPQVLQSWQDRFKVILIDEYQDTNHAQYLFVKLLASQRRQITVVGDPDQSIYSWRGADIQNILSFETDYPECGIIKLEQNYRSSSVILDGANELISRNTQRKPKALWTSRKGGEAISLFESFDEKHEAQYVVKQVLENTERGKTFSDQVVFYRVHAQSRILEDTLRRASVPYKIIGGTRFYDRKEIKDIIAYLRVVANPQDDISLKRIINVPTRGIGKKALEVLEAHALQQQIGFHEALRASHGLDDLTPKTRKSIYEFVGLIEKARAEHRQLSISDLLEMLLKNSRYVHTLEAEKTIESKARIENIGEFFSVIQDFEEIPNAYEEGNQLYSFLESISLVTDFDRWDASTNVLTLMSLHTAKGLEFPIVYMIGLEEGIFPNIKSYSADLADLEEERRLCYVGMTRAKDKLHMTFARERLLYGSRQRNLPSRFLSEIPSDLFENNISQKIPEEDDCPFAEEPDTAYDTDSFNRRKAESDPDNF
ncbi:MAG: ATP-dependent DNA helicase PcrA [Candidatus Omnitrophica bacterium]|nr:ATP-dependent DNA helicase PcrA [Candidatus Omnitrophota bacterium]